MYTYVCVYLCVCMCVCVCVCVFVCVCVCVCVCVTYSECKENTNGKSVNQMIKNIKYS